MMCPVCRNTLKVIRLSKTELQIVTSYECIRKNCTLLSMTSVEENQ